MFEFKEMISILLNPMTTFIMNKVTKVITVINNEKKKADLTRPIDLSLTSKVKNSFKAWYVDEIQIKVIKNGDFVGSVNQGGSVNFKELLINPHGNMTHTESVGHISKQEVFVNKILSKYHFSSQLITINPQEATSDRESGIKHGDFFIGIEQIKDKISEELIFINENGTPKKFSFTIKTINYEMDLQNPLSTNRKRRSII